MFGMMGGVHYSLYEDHLNVHLTSRMDADDGERYQVTCDGWSKVKLPSGPPPPPAPKHPAP
ncbi:hypothetical protein [Streptomyces sp. NPDC102360]|uniref:hypothetical protein n=1 Tax=Streptomyces sp. NPDC102360 TaxID=3366160 RepID=UPI00380D4B0A